MNSASLNLLLSMERGEMLVWCKKTSYYEFLGCKVRNEVVRDLIFQMPSLVQQVLEDDTQIVYGISKFGVEKLNAL